MSAKVQLPETWLAKPLHEVRETFFSDLERQYIEGLLRATGGRIGDAAKRAGLQERSLYEKMKQFGLRKEDFRRRHGDRSSGSHKPVFSSFSSADDRVLADEAVAG